MVRKIADKEAAQMHSPTVDTAQKSKNLARKITKTGVSEVDAHIKEALRESGFLSQNPTRPRGRFSTE